MDIEYTLRGGADDHIQLIQLLKVTNGVRSGEEDQEVWAAGLVNRNGVTEL